MPVLKENKQARFEHTILETFEAGIVLTGAEVKSAKAGHIQLKGAYATLRGNEVWLLNCHIAPYRYATTVLADDPTRNRRLLLTKREITTLIGKLQSHGLTLIPLSFYTKAGLVKVSLGLGRGKRKMDKRATIKKREIDRRIRKALKAH